MKSLIISALIAGAALCGLSAKADDKAPDRLNARVHDVNDASKKKGMVDVALRTISVETGVPLGEVESLHKRFPDMGPGGLMVSCVMADETKMPPESFIKKHNGGDGWGTIAKANRVPEEKIIARLDRLDRAMTAGNERRAPEPRH